MAKAWWARCARRTPTTPSCTNWPSSTGTCAPALTVPMCRPWRLRLLRRRTPGPPALVYCTPAPCCARSRRTLWGCGTPSIPTTTCPRPWSCLPRPRCWSGAKATSRTFARSTRPRPPGCKRCTPVPRSTTPARRCWAAACGKATPLCSAAGLRRCWMMGWCERMGLLKAMFQRTDGLPTCTHAHEVGDMFRPFRTDGEWALLIHGDLVGLPDVLVKTDALLNLLAKLCGLHGIRQHSAAVIPCPLCLRITQHGTHRFVELRNDGFRRFCRCGKTCPGSQVQLRQLQLVEGRDIRQLGSADWRCHRQSAQATVLSHAEVGGQVVPGHVHLARLQVGQRRASAPVWDVGDGQPQLCLEQLHAQVRQRAIARGGVVQLAWVLLHVFHELGE